MLETRRRLVDRPCRNHATTDSEPKPARNQTRRELLTNLQSFSDRLMAQAMLMSRIR